MINKRLLSEILKTKMPNCEVINIREEFDGEFNPCIMIEYTHQPSDIEDESLLLLNIHELSHLCKEWAWREGYSIESRYIGEKSTYTIIDRYKNKDFVLYIDQAKSIEVFSQACQWVLENKEKLEEK